MKKLHTINALYQEFTAEAGLKLNKVQKQIYRISILRVLLVLTGITGIICFRSESWMIWLGIALVTLLPFILLIKYHNRLFYRKDYLEKKIEVNQQEMAALNYDISAFDKGEEFIDPTHLYTFDLDVFGEHSLFQYICRTCTQPGKRMLASWFNKHLETKEEIVKRQEAVFELASEIKFRQRFRILGLLHKGKAADEAELKTWAKSSSIFRTKKMLRILPILVTGINAACIVFMLAGILSANIYGIIWIFFVIMSFSFTNRISKIQAVYGKKLQILSTYATLLQLIEEHPMQSTLLKEIKRNINGDKKKASYAIQQLSRLMHELDQRNNVFMYVILNGLFFWELRQMMRIEAWKDQYAEKLPQWLIALAEIDALNSLATFAYNYPGYTYPKLLNEADFATASSENSAPFCLHAEALGHPLMHRDHCIQNDINLKDRPSFIIITGANMAGKSTYLRTIGVNYLLACMGAPVCAHHMEIYPARLITSLRTSDSLNDNESYFFAELKRLKLIIDKLKNGEELFIILDEILKGTNSMDKQKGSFALIKQFMNLQANGIIATHDLLLGTLIDLYPAHIRNYCFEADITNNELTFSYHLRPGIAQNMNACFLMKKMGIAIPD